MRSSSSAIKYFLFFILVLFTIPLRAQIVLNEIYVRPDGLSSTPPNGLIYTDSKEYIELYNKGCTTIDVSGYFLATKQQGFGTVVTGITIRIPNVPAAIIPPGGHIVLGSAAPGVGLVGNIDIPITAADRCNYANNLVIANVDGWVALYNASGVAIDCVYWSGASGNITANPNDFNPGTLCLPTGSPAVTLQTPTQINASNPSIISYISNSTPILVYRQQDGSSNWSFASTFNAATLPWTINNASPTGNCNGGICVTPPLPVAPTVTTPINYCQNAPAIPLSATTVLGGTLNWYGTNATGGTASATAPTPTTSSVGTTTYYVSQTVAGCESPRVAIVVNVNPSFSPTISCGTSTLTSVQFNWSAVTGATGYTVSYQVNTATPVNIGAVGNVLTYTVNSLNSGDSVTITVTPTGGVGTCFTAATFSCATLVNNACGACATPTCPIVGVSSYANLNFSAGSCNTWSPQATNTTLTNYYLVSSDASGFLGIAQQATSSPGLCIVRSAVIRPLVTSCNVATAIAPSVINANGVVSGFNPEWYGLTPNTQYVVVETVVLGAACSLTSLCTNYYGCTTPATPTASVTVQPTCTTPTGTIVVSSPTGAGNLYSIDGVNYQVSATFTGLAPNNYTVTIKKTPSGCVSNGTVLTVSPVPTIAVPTASVTVQPTCTTPTGTIVVTAPTGANFEYSVNGTTYQTGSTFTGLAPNTYNVTVRNTTNGCVSLATVVTINAIPTIATPTASATVQPTCTTPTGTIVVTAPTGANLEYSVNGVAYQASATFTGLVPNTYNVTVRNTTNGCVSTATTVTINAVPTIATPTASVTVQPTCAIPTGTIVITAPIGANLEYSVNGTIYQTGTTFTGLAPNTYNVTVRNTTNGCVSTATTITVNAVPTIAAPTASATVQPTCTIPTGTIVVTAPVGANFEYSVNGTTYQSTTTFTGLVPNIYNVTVRNTSNNCLSVATPVTINAVPTVVAPTASVTFQPTCTTPTGTILVTAPTGANLEYSVNGVAYQSSNTFTGLTPNTYNVTVRNTTNGCVSSAISLTVNAIPSVAAPTASATVQPTCTTPSGTIVVTTPTGANFEYSINGTTYQPGTTFTGLLPNTYAVTVRNTTNGCVSIATNVTINPIPTIAIPIANVTFQPTCITPTGTILVTSPIGANLEYSINGVTYQSSTTFSGLVPNNYNVTVRNTTNGCVSTAISLTVNPIPSVSVPTVLTQQPDCTILTGAIEINSPLGISLQYSLDGITFQTSPNFVGLVPNTYTVTVRDVLNGCTNVSVPIVIVNSVNDVIVNQNPAPFHLCDPSNDGFIEFDLTQAINSITGGTPYTVTFHETITDANTDGTDIPNPSVYPNINPWGQIIFVRVESTTTSCFEVIQLQLIVDPTPEATEPDDYIQCDYSGAVGYESFDLTMTISQILGNIDPALNTVSFYTSQINAENDSNPITGVTGYVNQTIWNQTLYVRVETTATGCYDIVTLNLVVNPLPNSTQPNYPQYSLCDDDQTNIGFETFDLASQVPSILLGQTGMEVTFYPSLANAQNDTNAITDLLYQNQIIYVQTLGIRITNTITSCYVISTMDIRVEPLPEPIPPTEPYTICDDNQDGYSCDFDLTTLEADILQGAAYTLSFYETQDDAEIGDSVTAIDPTATYCNINPFTQTLYVRAVNPLTGCWSVMPIILNVNPSPIAPINLDDITVCDDDNNPYNAITGIDLTQRTPDVLAQQPATGSYTVTYYTTEQAAMEGTAPIIPATYYVTSTGTTIWVRVEDNITGCYNLGSFQIIINTPLQLITPAPLSVCDDDATPNDQFHSFDLTVKDAEITQNLSGYTVTYYPSYALAQAGGPTTITDFTAYTNIFPAVQTLGVVVTSAAGCQSITTLDIRVLPVPTPNTNPPALAPKCDDNNPGDMLEVFDLTTNAAYIANGDPNVTLHYYATQADALVPQNEILIPATALVGGNVWIRVENNRIDYQGNHCFILVEQPLTVNPLPAVTQPLAPYRMCDDDTDGIAFFDLTNPQLAISILGATQSPADFTITYYATAAGANPFTNTGETPLAGNYQNVIPNSQDVYIRVVNDTSGCVNATGILTLAVEKYATASGPQTYASCDDYLDPFDGVFQLDLTQYEAAILNGQDPTIFLISYYHSQADAEAGTNAIPLAEAQAYITQPDTDTIWIKVENTSNTIVPVCYALTTIDISIERYPNPIINTPNDVTTICVDYNTNVVVRPLTLDSGITNTSAYTFEWFEDGSTTPIVGATGSTYTVDTASPTGATRNYTVHVTSNSPLACATTSASFAVIQSGQAAIPAGTLGYTVSNAFTASQIITVDIIGYGTYEYSLDDGPRQTSNIFEGVSLGSHIIHIWDTEGGIAFSCEELIIQNVQIIDYPHYFTPNGDGIHDTWNVVGLSNFASVTKIYIFDRYGKLLKQLSAAGEGWDGTYNGNLMPSDDYWFTVEYPEQNEMKQFKSHFAMKR